LNTRRNGPLPLTKANAAETLSARLLDGVPDLGLVPTSLAVSCTQN
jgi:hypothetical protein